jgi:AsmA protein
LDKVNFDRYLPPPVTEKSIQNQAISFNETLSKPATQVPVETLKKWDVNGKLTIEELKVKNLAMQGLRFIINAKNGILQSQQSVDRLYQGSHHSKILFDVNGKQPQLSVTGQFSHVQIEPFVNAWQGQSRVSGLMNLQARLEGSGNSDKALKMSLNGRLDVEAEDVVIRGVNLQKIIDNGKILLGDAPLAEQNKKEKTFFSTVSANAIVSNGFLINNDLSAVASKAQVNGMGDINLISEELDYKIIAVLLKEKSLSALAAPSRLPVFIHVGGNFNAPTYQVDLAAMGVGL